MTETISEGSGSEVYVALGANLQDPAGQLKNALLEMSETDGLQLVATSSFYSSEPMGPQDQPPFVNAVCRLECSLTPIALLDALQTIERDNGRHRDPARGARHWGPRSLDLDILLYGDIVLNEARLTIPHPGVVKRSFVLLPLLEISPDIVVPGIGAAAEFAGSVEDFGIKKLEPEI